MILSKGEYVVRSLKKVARKKWELFVISRIVHGLDDDDIEFVTQQLVRRGDGSRALTDLYFPQFSLHLEVDEGHHHKQLGNDERRAQDIIEVTEHEIERLKISEDGVSDRKLVEIRRDIDAFIERLKGLKRDQLERGSFVPWSQEGRYRSEPIIKRGYISIEDNVAFRTQSEALKCFGFKGSLLRRAAWTFSDEGDFVWFPRLYPHFIWVNELRNSGEVIIERAAPEEPKRKAAMESIAKQLKQWHDAPNRRVVVFAKAKDPLGQDLLRYVGSFQANLEKSRCDVIWFDRVSKREEIQHLIQ